MTTLTTEKKDHKVLFTTKDAMPIWITREQAEAIRQSKSHWITITDTDTGFNQTILYDGKKSNIDRIIPVDWKKVQELQGLRYFNDYWDSRLVVDMDSDDSVKKYKCSGYLFSLYMDLKHWFQYAQDITNEKRELFTRWAENKDYKTVSETLLQEVEKLQQK